MDRKKLLRRLARGDYRNVAFGDLESLVRGFGFQIARTRGSHHIFRHGTIPEILNLQDVQGEAKPYQIRQFLRIVERYNLQMEERE